MLARERIAIVNAFNSMFMRLLASFPSRLCCFCGDFAALFGGQAFSPGFTAFGRPQRGESLCMRVLNRFGLRLWSVPFLADDVLHHGLGEQNWIAWRLRRFLWFACSGWHGTIMA